MKRWLVPLAIVLALALLVPACSSASTSTTTPPTSTVAPTSSTVAPTSSTVAPTSSTVAPTSTTTKPTTTTTTTTPAGGPKRGGVMKLITSGPTNIGIPWEANAPTDLFYVCPSIETLFRTDDKGNITPWLATGYTIAPDYKSITLTLRKGVKFQDGTDFDASAVKYNLETQAASPLPDMKAITSVDVVDQYTVKVNLSQYQPQMLSLWAVGRPGWMVSPTWAKTATPDQMRLHPVGTGPFKFDSFTRDVSVKFVRFDQYWQTGKPYLDGIEYDIVADNTTGVIAFRSGAADVDYNVIQKDAYDLKNMGFNVTSAQASIYQWIPDSANANSPWSNVDVRRAGQYAIDTVAMAKAQGFGWADPYWNQVFPKGNPAYDPTIVGYPYDVAKAKALLAKAGYPTGFKTSLYITVPSVGDLEVATQGYLAAVGIVADIKPLPGASYTQANTQGWQNGLLRSQSVASLGADPGYQMTTYLSTPAKQWVSLARPADFQDLLNKANAEYDAAKRWPLYQAVCKNIIDTNAMIISTWGGYLLAAKQNYVHGENIRTLWTMTWTPEDAWMDK